jgi:hypothetical protein
MIEKETIEGILKLAIENQQQVKIGYLLKIGSNAKAPMEGNSFQMLTALCPTFYGPDLQIDVHHNILIGKKLPVNEVIYTKHQGNFVDSYTRDSILYIPINKISFFEAIEKHCDYEGFETTQMFNSLKVKD